MASGTCGTNATWTFDESTGVLTISGTGAMDDYAIGNSTTTAPWGSYSSTITSVNITGGITSIGEMAFSQCQKLTSVTFPNSLTTIKKSAFSNCQKLTSVTFPNSLTTIQEAAFRACVVLTNIYFASSSPPTIEKEAFVLPFVGGTVNANVYTVGWGSDEVFTDDVRNSENLYMKLYTNFTYYIWEPPSTGSTVHINVNGEWKTATPYVNVGGEWKEVVATYVNVNGEWKETV